MNIRTALETAIRFEMSVRDIYRNASQATGSESTRLMLLDLARTEHEHLERLRKAYAQLERQGKLQRFTSEQADQREFDAALQTVTDHIAVTAREMRAVEHLRAIEKAEKETYRYFCRLSETLPGNHKTYFERFIEMEKGHLDEIRSRIRNSHTSISVPPR